MQQFADMKLNDFLDQAASDAPVPGGGGIAALAGALGAAMASMAANFTVGRPKYVRHDESMRRALDVFTRARHALLQAVDEDAAAFSGINAAYKLPKDDEAAKAKRKTAIQEALTASMRAPLSMAGHCLRIAEELPNLAEVGNPNLLSDVEVAGIMLEAAVRAARTNVLVNSSQLSTEEARQAESEANRAVEATAALSARAASIISDRRSA